VFDLTARNRTEKSAAYSLLKNTAFCTVSFCAESESLIIVHCNARLQWLLLFKRLIFPWSKNNAQNLTKNFQGIYKLGRGTLGSIILVTMMSINGRFSKVSVVFRGCKEQG
jgi:hypothetical protein